MKPCLCILAGWLASAGLAMTQDAPGPAPAAIVDPLPWWRTGAVQARWDSAEGLDMGGVNALIPLHASMAQGGSLSGTMFFLEPYGQWVEGGPHQAGLGLGFRQLHSRQTVPEPDENPKFSDEGFYVGGHLFFDRANTRSEQNIWQLTLGAEAGTRWLDLRGQYHFPVGDGKTTQYRSVTTYSQTSESNGIQADQTLTVDSTLSLFTEGLRGWETEAAFLVPGIDRWVDLRVLAGYAAFESPRVDSLHYDTWRMGLDFHPVPAVTLSAIWHENEALFGANWVYGVGFQIPFEIDAPGNGACGTGGGFWGPIREAFRPQRRHLADRFLEPTRSHPLPMQIGTSIQNVHTTTTYNGSFTLPDGRVEHLSSKHSSSSSGAGTYATGSTSTTIVNAGSLQLSGAGAVSPSTATLTSGTLILNGSAPAGTNSNTSTNTVTTGTTGTSSTTTVVTAPIGSNLVITGPPNLAIGSGSAANFTVISGGTGVSQGTVIFSTNSATFTVGGRRVTIGNLTGTTLLPSAWAALLQNLPQGNQFILQNDGSGNYTLVPDP